NVYCEIHPYTHIPEFDTAVKGVILSGSPYSVRQDDAPRVDFQSLQHRFPLLAVCYGAQYIAQHSGGAVVASTIREYGRANLHFVVHDSPLLADIPADSQVWMSHGDTISSIPEGFDIIASTNKVDVAAYHIKGTNAYGIQ